MMQGVTTQRIGWSPRVPGRVFWIVVFGFLVVSERTPDTVLGQAGGKVEEITFDDVKLDLQKDEPFVESKLTDRVKQLDKKAVRIRGWILPASVFQQTGIKSFVLVRDNMQCCFGPGAALYDCMVVEMEPGKTADFTTRPVAVEGVFQVKEFKFPDGKQYAIYHLRARSVK